MFDESHNKVCKKWQMDFHIRYWDDDENVVTTRYYFSEYMGKAAAEDVHKSFNDGVAGLDKEKHLQVSPDGPNVNLKFLKNIAEERKK